MFLILGLFLVLTTSGSCTSSLTFGSLIVTQVQDAISPYENSNGYVVISTSALEGFFVDSGSSSNTTLQMISTFQQQVDSVSKPPKFVFITHGHPDHLGGIAIIKQAYPSVPIYVISQQVVTEAVRWTTFSCNNSIYSVQQCGVNYGSVLHALSSPQSQLYFNDSSVQLSAQSVIVKAESSYAGYLGLKTSIGDYLLFTGDVMTIRSHLWVSNFFDTQTLPASDDALCAWAGTMQASVCNLQLGNQRPLILPGHGPMSGTSEYINDVAQNLIWLRALRNLTFNSCNTTYIWFEMFRLFPNFGEAKSVLNGALNTHVPADANSVNCNCNNGSPTVCPVYHTPPSCMHLDITDSDTTLACDMRINASVAASSFQIIGKNIFILFILSCVKYYRFIF